MEERAVSERIEAIRHFNRFYTRQIGVLQEGLLRSPYSLTEARILYELAQRDSPAASELVRDLGLDAGYLSRILRRFQKDGLVERRSSLLDGRQYHLILTELGRAAFAPLNERSHAEIGALIGRLSTEDQRRLVASMQSIERLLGGAPESRSPYLLRMHQPGDLGWVVQRHGALYAEEYGWDSSFEGLVAGIVSTFVERYDPKREQCWIAERDGENVGSVFLVKQSEEVAKLRLLLVEPRARGLGIGARLVQECERFARQAGYRRITLWTNSILVAARAIYERAGYRLVQSEPHHSFGHDLIGETWELTL